MASATPWTWPESSERLCQSIFNLPELNQVSWCCAGLHSLRRSWFPRAAYAGALLLVVCKLATHCITCILLLGVFEQVMHYRTKELRFVGSCLQKSNEIATTWVLLLHVFSTNIFSGNLVWCLMDKTSYSDTRTLREIFFPIYQQFNIFNRKNRYVNRNHFCLLPELDTFVWPEMSLRLLSIFRGLFNLIISPTYSV